MGEKIMTENIPKLRVGRRNQATDCRNTGNPKLDKYKENTSLAHRSKTAETQRQSLLCKEKERRALEPPATQGLSLSCPLSTFRSLL